MSDRWYVAYGSNLSVDQKVDRTGTIRAAIPCQLRGHRLAFNKRAASGRGVYANIVPDESARVWGVAYLCDEAAIRALDRYEGVSGGHYRHERVEVVTDDGRVVQALTYVAGAEHTCEGRRPEPAYLKKILDGARQHCLPEEYLTELEALGSGPAG